MNSDRLAEAEKQDKPFCCKPEMLKSPAEIDETTNKLFVF